MATPAKRDFKAEAKAAIWVALTRTGEPFRSALTDPDANPDLEPELEQEVVVQINRILRFLGYEPANEASICKGKW